MDDRLYRSRTDRMIAGVAGGLADRYDFDPSLVRVGWAAVIILSGGIFLLLYIVMAIVVPEEPFEWSGPGAAAPVPGASEATTGTTADAEGGEGQPAGAADAAATAGTAAATAGTAAATAISPREARRAARHARRSSDAPLIFGAILVLVGIVAFAGQLFPNLDFDLFWPIVLIVFGAALIVAATRRTS